MMGESNPAKAEGLGKKLEELFKKRNLAHGPERAQIGAEMIAVHREYQDLTGHPYTFNKFAYKKPADNT